MRGAAFFGGGGLSSTWVGLDVALGLDVSEPLLVSRGVSSSPFVSFSAALFGALSFSLSEAVAARWDCAPYLSNAK